MSQSYQPTDLRQPAAPPALAAEQPRPRPQYQHQTGPTDTGVTVAAVANARPTLVDAVAEDARAAMAEQQASVTSIPDWPAGAPKLRPLMRLGFEERANAMDLYSEIEKSANDMPNKGDQVGPAEAAKMYRLMAKMDRLLASVAEEKELYHAWVENNDEAAFGQLFTAYMARFQPGEASSSSS